MASKRFPGGGVVNPIRSILGLFKSLRCKIRVRELLRENARIQRDKDAHYRLQAEQLRKIEPAHVLFLESGMEALEKSIEERVLELESRKALVADLETKYQSEQSAFQERQKEMKAARRQSEGEIKEARKAVKLARLKLHVTIKRETEASDKFTIVTLFKDKLDPARNINEAREGLSAAEAHLESFEAGVREKIKDLKALDTEWENFRKVLAADLESQRRKVRKAEGEARSAMGRREDALVQIGMRIAEEESLRQLLPADAGELASSNAALSENEQRVRDYREEYRLLQRDRWLGVLYLAGLTALIILAVTLGLWGALSEAQV